MERHMQEYDNPFMAKGIKLKPTIQLDKLHYTPKPQFSQLRSTEGGSSVKSKGRNTILPPIPISITSPRHNQTKTMQQVHHVSLKLRDVNSINDMSRDALNKQDHRYQMEYASSPSKMSFKDVLLNANIYTNKQSSPVRKKKERPEITINQIGREINQVFARNTYETLET